MRVILYKYSLVFILMLASIHLTAQITSTFTANAEGWTTPNDADGTIGYSGTGGNPVTGGMVFGNPFVIPLGAGNFYVPFYFVAPGAYLGNRSTYYNGTLQYDVQQSTTGAPNQYAEVALFNSSLDTLYYFPTVSNQPPSAPAWTPYSVVLNNAQGFWKTSNSPLGAIASAVLMQNVLANLTRLEIRGLYRNANVTTRLDNVSFRPPIVVTTQPGSIAVCNGVTTTLTTAATGNPAITYRWQFETSPGIWADLNNTGGYSNVATATLSVNTTGNFGAGNYRCRISGTAVVDAFTITAAITVNPLPTAPTATGNAACGSSAITLNAAGAAAGQYRWYTVPTGGVAIAGQTNSAYTTPVIAVTTTYYVAINNGTCESTRTPVVATINTIPAAPTATGNAACGSSAITLNAAGAAAGQYRWYTVPTGGVAVAGQTNAAYTTPVIAITTTYYVAINNGTCESTRTPVVATINTIPAAPTTTGNAACGSSAITLNAAGAAAGQYRWYTVPTGGVAIAGQTNAAYTTPVIAVTTTYYVAINNGCESTRTAVTATINTLPSAPTATGNAACGSSAITINAAGAAAGQYRWYTVPTAGVAIAGQTNAVYTTPVITLTTTYYVAINNGTCESTRTPVVATINTFPSAPTVNSNAACGPISITLTAAGGAAGQYRWYSVPTGGTALAGQTNSAFQTPVLTTTTTYYVSINNGTCESTRTPAIATILTNGCNTIPPTISPVPLTTIVAGQIVLNLVPLITAPGVLNVNSITITSPPSSGASASVNNGILTIDYAGKVFTGNEFITIQACDVASLCSEQTFTIEVAGDIVVYNGISPNNDPARANETFYIKYIDVIPSKQKNTVAIFNRWGSKVFEVSDYNNNTRVFKGLNDNGDLLPTGTYFYKISFDSGDETKTGYLVIKH